MPSKKFIQEHKSLRFIAHHLHHEDLWHITKTSISRGTAVGLFMAFMPVPFQMLLAVLVGVPVRANIALAVGLVWISNPLTIPVFFYACYKFGIYLLPAGKYHVSFLFSADNIWQNFQSIWPPLLLGCFVLGAIVACLGYFACRLMWWWSER